MGRMAHLYAQQYSWECIADRVLVLYSKALAPMPVLQLAGQSRITYRLSPDV
jgi:hypothetical protein